MKYLKLLLWPFSLVYGSIMALRNFCYDRGIMRATQFEIPVIGVGNLTVGGTGKTPHVEYLLRLLRKYNIATLSRGYKRQTKGFILAGAQDSAATLGDEPFQYHQDFPEVAVAVSEDRVHGIQQLQQLVSGLEVVVLDDAMQHRPVKPSLNILITDYHRPFFQDLVMPAGLLREPQYGARRADMVIMSKCPATISAAEKQKLVAAISKYTQSGTPVFFTTYTYGAPVSIGRTQPLFKDIILLTGIANATPLVQHLASSGYTLKQHLAYSDHYSYTLQDLHKLQQLLALEENKNTSILTTRKDAVKLISPELRANVEQLPVFYIPIEVQFLGEGDKFDQLVLAHVQQRAGVAKANQIVDNKY